MKPLHIGLLLGGAALAGGLAVEMTRPLPTPAVAPAVQPANSPAVVRITPAVVSIPAVKPSPIPRDDPPVRATAPQPIYDEPPKPAIRKNKPILTASAKPTQWIPGQYESPAEPEKIQSTPLTSPAGQNATPAPVVVKDAPPAPHQATLRTGMTIPIRLGESLSSDKSVVGGTFEASLAEPLAADGFVIAEKGARVTGRIVDSQKAGRFAGTSRLELGLTNLMTSDGQQVSISTDSLMKLGDTVPPETVIRFRLASRVTITERQIAGR